MNKKNRSLEEVVEKLTDLRTKKELEKFFECGGLIYRDVDARRNEIIVCDDGYMEENWREDKELRKNFATFEEYAKYEAEACLASIGMTEEEIADELKGWF